MATAIQNLRTALNNATARLAELDTVPVGRRARMSYSLGQRSVGWNEYRAALISQIKDTQEMIRSAQAAEGPFVVRSRARA